MPATLGMSVFRSITAKLIVALCLGTTVLWCGAAGSASLASYRELNEAFDLTLMEAAHRLLPLVARSIHGREEHSAKAERPHLRLREEYLSYQVSDAEGHIVFRAPDAPELPYQTGLSPGFRTAGDYRIFTETDPASGLSITVAETTHGRWEAVSGTI